MTTKKRITMAFSDDIHNLIRKLAAEYGVTQQQMVTVIFETFDPESAKFKAKMEVYSPDTKDKLLRKLMREAATLPEGEILSLILNVAEKKNA